MACFASSAFSTGNEGNEGNEVHVQTADLQGISIRTYNSTSSFQILVSGILTTGYWTSVLCQFDKEVFDLWP